MESPDRGGQLLYLQISGGRNGSFKKINVTELMKHDYGGPN